MRAASLALVAAATLHAAETIDCVAVTAGRAVVTRSAIEEQTRIAAFLNSEPVDLSPAARRRTAERLVDVVLIRREMEISRYAAADAAGVEKMLANLRAGRAALKSEDFARALDTYRIDEAALRRHLALQSQTLRFIELRFRSSSTVTDGEVEIFYRDHFAPEFVRTNPGKQAPELDEVRDRIEAALLEQRVDQSMEQWLKEARRQTRVVFHEEACP